ncbi:RNA polymerase sigma-70 factor (ECF subfamily) [Filimonas zeae]|uniref:DNA-directed RNA polymerase sigma-70 factor n=1 Tax=Filimonas zeae TaxID=1737353 RepID=A0A917MXJ0_9BACT|nr:sigma-70 family RNA polymerase sigma factor [Filimonas zeae]MDR6341474.1 RNA polymerase sigma-70 factor (ECF subfamily) [Filimonas zeae]GGH75684.1 DNA-directed RNA polymerase sigma-70 factor [Filimonas zeae]
MEQSQFLQLVNEHQGIIHKICRLYRNSREDREDLFQEIVFQLWKSAPGFGGRAQFSTWLYRVALSTALAGYRKKAIPVIYMEALPEQQADNTPRDEQQQQLWQALTKLPDADKAIIALYLENLSYQEIADILGITHSNVGVKLNRAKSRLQQLLKQ